MRKAKQAAVRNLVKAIRLREEQLEAGIKQLTAKKNTTIESIEETISECRIAVTDVNDLQSGLELRLLISEPQKRIADSKMQLSSLQEEGDVLAERHRRLIKTRLILKEYLAQNNR